MRKSIAVAIAVGLLLVFFFHFHAFLKKKVFTAEFKQQTEKRLSEILRARVKVGKIHFGLLRHLSLSGLQIEQEKSKSPIQIGVQKIVIQYNLLNFFSQRFKVPADVLLESPVVTIPSVISPFSLPAMVGSAEKLADLRHLELQDGTIGFILPNTLGTLAFEKIKGRASFGLDGVLNARFKSELGRIAKGSVSLEGSAKPAANFYDLTFHIRDGSLFSPFVIPLTEMNGEIRLSGSTLTLDRFQMKLHDLPVALSGKIEDAFGPYPKWDLAIEIAYSKQALTLEVRGDQKTQSVSGRLTGLGGSVEFLGSITIDSTGFQLHHLTMTNGYQAYGAFRFTDGHYMMKAEKEKQRFSFDVNFADLGTELQLNINHLPVLGYDVTTFARIYLSPAEMAWQAGNRRFAGWLRTDYFIVDYQPLRNFQAEFEISGLGINPLTARWGNASEWSGSVAFTGEPSIDGHFSIQHLKLSELKFLGSHPMPLVFEGELDGKMRMVGPIRKPDITGKFVIQDGRIGNFKYDQAILEFYGQPPHFQLLDSKIIRKDNTFLMKGDVDFELENIFQKVKIVSLDQIVIWKGIDITSEIETIAKNQPLESRPIDILRPLNVETSGPGTMKFEAEYEVAKGKSLKLTAEEEESGKQIVTVGPRLKF